MLGKRVNSQPTYTMYRRKRHPQTAIPQVQLSVDIVVVLTSPWSADSICHFCTSEVTVKGCRMKIRVNSGTRRSEVKPKQTNWTKLDEIKHEEEPAYMKFNVGSNPQKNPDILMSSLLI